MVRGVSLTVTALGLRDSKCIDGIDFKYRVYLMVQSSILQLKDVYILEL